jgi:hypothetical protein
MDPIENSDGQVRAKHRDWPTDFDSRNIFTGSVSLDPAEALRIWANLSRSTWETEIASFPALIHHAFISRLKASYAGRR